MSVDFDRPRDDDSDRSGEEPGPLGRGRGAEPDTELDDREDTAETMDLPGADLSGEELGVRVVPMKRDEFTCSRCFLVHHRSQLARHEGDRLICRDCV
ncbi:DUF4193 domain-containing protein [Rhodococcus sp. D2-41]|uniref:DUF4193 domain-containing protein n=1 Tax=Speluncibacter jeojiensis TaxID=2710754 RepID=A0A9X4RCR1_9ACTN|nr:DUF4193 family protein [Rhodococcus sp. D2-41]MDG3010894.1 DUF4193 domain-containing protein [Rhodococcus sp. D2-41]MDG3013868.1 DUF4193 domain-containing protein [Corynebacteriales bacterium D3-21]